MEVISQTTFACVYQSNKQMLTYTGHDKTSKVALEGKINHLQKGRDGFPVLNLKTNKRTFLFSLFPNSSSLPPPSPPPLPPPLPPTHTHTRPDLLYGMEVLVVEVSEKPEDTWSQNLS